MKKQNFTKSFLTHYIFSSVEPIRKTQEEGKYLLLTTTASKYNTQLEADRLLTNHFKNENVACRLPTRRNNPIINNHFSTYAEALSKSQPPTPANYPLLTSHPFSIQRPYSILFSSNRNDDAPTQPLQKSKLRLQFTNYQHNLRIYNGTGNSRRHHQYQHQGRRKRNVRRNGNRNNDTSGCSNQNSILVSHQRDEMSNEGHV